MVSAQRASVERGLRIPLEVQNLPENLEMVDPPQEAVDVRVRGAADALGRLVAGDLVANIDLSSAQPGRRLFHISPDRVKAPFAVEITQVTPAQVAIRFEPSATRVVADSAVFRRRARAGLHRRRDFRPQAVPCSRTSKAAPLVLRRARHSSPILTRAKRRTVASLPSPATSAPTVDFWSFTNDCSMSAPPGFAL